jgi:hypothetical protein
MLNLNEAATVAGGGHAETHPQRWRHRNLHRRLGHQRADLQLHGSGRPTASLAATAINVNGATVQDSAGNTASFSLTGLTQTGPQIDITAPDRGITGGGLHRHHGWIPAMSGLAAW